MSDLSRKIDSFESRVKELALNLFKNATYECISKERFLLKSRVKIRKDLFVAIYYNPGNERQDFALIYRGRRIFGYDNLDFWHYHPFKSPKDHIPCARPKMNVIWQEIKRVVQLLNR